MNKFFKHIVPAALLLLAAGTTSCVNDLDVKPIDPNLVTADSIQAEQLFNKCYACIGVAGNGGANGDSDVDGIDGGTSGYVRQVWNANELTSDEAICGWGDPGIPEFCYNNYDASHPMLTGLYYRLYTSIVFCNDYLKSFEDYDDAMTAEVRFIRALDYYYLLDGWGNVALVTSPTASNPEQSSRQEIFQWLEEELLDLRENLNDLSRKDRRDTAVLTVTLPTCCWPASISMPRFTVALPVGPMPPSMPRSLWMVPTS